MPRQIHPIPPPIQLRILVQDILPDFLEFMNLVDANRGSTSFASELAQVLPSPSSKALTASYGEGLNADLRNL